MNAQAGWTIGAGRTTCGRPDLVSRVACGRGLLCALLVGCLAVPSRGAAGPGDWWDFSYGYRRKQTVTAGASTVPAGTVAAIVFDHAALVGAGLSQISGNDIRLAYWNGSSWTEIPRTLAEGSSWNSTATRVLFETQAQIGGGGSDDNYYLYYGNPSAGTPTSTVPAARWFQVEQLAEQSTASTTFQDIPGMTLIFAPGDAGENWLIFASGVMRSSSTLEQANEMRLLVNGVEVDLWSHQNLDATAPNGAGFVTFDRLTGVTGNQTVKLQHRAIGGTTYASQLRLVAALVPPGADLQFAETDALTQQTGSNLVLQTLSFTPSGAGGYLVFGKLSQHERPGSSTVQAWLEDDAGGIHPDAPAGTRFSNARAAWQPLFLCFRRNMPAGPRTLRLRGTSSLSGGEASEWLYRRLMALRTDAWESAEYSESLAQSTTTSAAFQVKNSLTTAVPPGPRDYLVIQMARISGDSTAGTARKAGELREGGVALVRTNHRINRDGSAGQGYHHIIGVVQGKNTAASSTYSNGFLSPDGITVQMAESTIAALRYHEPGAVLGGQETPPTVTFTAAGQNAPEAGGAVTITVQLSGVSSQNVTVPFSVAGTASNPADYTITASPVVIPAGSLTATITVTVNDDFLNDDDETVVVTMGDPVNALKGAITVHTVTIVDDEPPGVTVTESGGSTSVTEGGATDTYTLALQSQPTANVLIVIMADTQVTVNPSMVVFTPLNWNLPRTVTVTAVDDAVAEGLHAGRITHEAASADPDYDDIGVAEVAVGIVDNDVASVVVAHTGGSTDAVEGGATDSYTVVLTSEPLADVVITPSPDDQSIVDPASRTFTATNWNVPQTFTVTAVDDSVAEGPHVSVIGHAAASADPAYNGLAVAALTANITDNDVAGVQIVESGGSTAIVEGGATDSYTVVLTSRPLGDVNVTVAPDAQSTVGAGAATPVVLTFTPVNWNIPQTVNVAAVDDAVAEGNHPSTISHSASSADPAYNGIAVPAVVAAVADNDTAGIQIAESGGSTAVAEGGATDTYTVVLQSQPTANVTFTITPDADAAVNPAVLVFTPANWNVAQTVTVTAVDDFIAEGAHVSIIAHAAASSDPMYHGIAVPSVNANIADNDSAGVTVTQSGGSTAVAEGGATDSYTLVLTSEPTAPVVITVTPDGQADLGAGAGVAVTRTFTAANWNIPQTVTVAAVDDAIAEGPHSASIGHAAASADPFYHGIGISGVTAQVTDNDTAYVNFTSAGQSAAESSPQMVVTVALSNLSTQDVVVPFTVGGTASSPADYTITASPVTIPAGQWTATIVITLNDDFLNDDDETVIVTLGDPVNGARGTLTVHTATILDDDPPGVTVTESGGSTDVSESGTTDTYTLVLQSMPQADVTVSLATDGQTTVNPTVVTFTPGTWNVPRTITVTAVNDLVAEGLHGSVITHAVSSADGDYNGLAVAAVTANITDDDLAGVTVTQSGGSTAVVEGGALDSYTLVLTSEPTADVTVTAGPDGQLNLGAGPGAPVQFTFTPGNWNVPQMVTVAAVDDLIAEGGHVGWIVHNSASADPFYQGLAVQAVQAAIADNDTAGVAITQSGGSTAVSEDGAVDSYTLVLTSEPTADVVVTVDPDDQLDLGAGRGASVVLTFTPANWNIPRTIDVAAVDDAAAEGAHIGLIAHAAASADPMYNGLSVPGLSVSIADNDHEGVVLAESDGGTAVAEGGAGDGYTVVLTSQPLAEVEITVDPDAQTDLGAGPGVAVVLTFTPADWNVPQQVAVAAVDDLVAEGPHTSTITHAASSADPVYDGLVVASLIVQVADNDTAGVQISEGGGGTAVSEAGLTDTYSIELTSQPTAVVVVTVTPGGQLDLEAGPGVAVSRTFTPANWHVPQNVTVAAVDDAVAEGPHAGVITHSAASADGFYNGIGIAGVTAQIADNDTAGIVLTETGGSTAVAEGGAGDVYTLVLTSEPTANVVITVTPDGQLDLGAGAGNAVQLTFTAANWNVPQTVSVTAVDDIIAEGPHNGVITHAVASADAMYNGMAVSPVTAAVTDNDTAVVSFTSAAQSAFENAGPMTVTVQLSTPSAHVVTVPFTVGGTASDPGDYSITSGPLTLDPGQLTATITITVNDDFVNEPDETVIITMGDPTNAVRGAPAVHTATIRNDEAPGVAIAESGGATAVAEGGAGDSYTLVLLSQPTVPVVITATPDAQTDLGAGPGAAVQRTFLPAQWNVPQTITVSAVDDALAEGPHTSTIAHAVASADGDYDGAAAGAVVVAVTDNDVAWVSFTAAAQSALESEPSMTVTVRLSTLSVHDVTVPFTVGGTAAQPSDYSITPGPVVIPAGQWTATITITLRDDPINEPDETVILTLGNPIYGSKGTPDVHTATIRDDEAPGIVVTESGGSTAVTEGGATDTYALVLLSEPAAPVTVTISTDGQVTVDPAAVVFDAGNWDVPQTVTVTAADDIIAEGPHVGTIFHTSASADPDYNGLHPADVGVTITDNDTALASFTSAAQSAFENAGPMAVTVQLSTPSAHVVTVPFTVGGTASHPGDYSISPSPLTLAPGQLTATITITVHDDFVSEPDETVVITMGDPTNALKGAPVVHSATIRDDEVPGVAVAESGGTTAVTEGGVADTYSLVLASEPTADVVITATPDGQLDLGAGPGNPLQLTFTAGNWNVPQTVTVAAVDDHIAEGPHSATVVHSVASTDPDYDGLHPADVIVVVADNDIAAVSFTSAAQSAFENAGPMTVTVQLSTPSAHVVTVPFTVSGTASDPGDYSVTPGPLTLAPGQLSATITITVHDDFVHEPDETVILTLGDPTGADRGAPSMHTATIRNDDGPGLAIMESDGSTGVGEGGRTDTYALRLLSQPTAPVAVIATPDGQLDLGAGPGRPVRFSFTAGDWNVPRTVTVAAVDDMEVQGDRDAFVIHAADSADPSYGGLPPAAVIVRVADNDSYWGEQVAGEGPPPGVEIVIVPRGAGRVRASPVGKCAGGLSYVLRSVPFAGYGFARWEDGLQTRENPVTVCLTGPMRIVARFGRAQDIGHDDQVMIVETVHYGLCGPLGAVGLSGMIAGLLVVRTASCGRFCRRSGTAARRPEGRASGGLGPGLRARTGGRG